MRPPHSKRSFLIRLHASTRLISLAAASLVCVGSAGAQLVVSGWCGAQDEPFYKTGRHATPGYLGVGLRDVDKDTAAQLHLPDRHGAEVVTVDRDAPAGQVGLRGRDVLRALNGTRIDSSDHLHRLLHALPPGREVLLSLVRDGEQLNITVQLADEAVLAARVWNTGGESGDDGGPPSAMGARSGSGLTTGGSRGGALSLFGAFSSSPLYTGAELDPLSIQLADYFGVHDGAGLLVRTVSPESPASNAGLHAGDVILRVNSQAVVSRTDWMKQLHENRGRPMLLTVVRNKQQQTLTLVTGDARKKS